MAGPVPRRPGDTFADKRQRLRILPKHVMRQTQGGRGNRRIERIEPHIRLENVDRTPRISRNYEGGAKAPIHVVRIQRNGPLELGYRGLMLTLELAFEHEDASEQAMSQRQIWIDLNGIARELVGLLKDFPIKKVTIERDKPGYKISLG